MTIPLVMVAMNGYGSIAGNHRKYVPHGENICAQEVADIALVSGVSTGGAGSQRSSFPYSCPKSSARGCYRSGYAAENAGSWQCGWLYQEIRGNVDNLTMDIHLGVLANVRSALN